MATTENLYVRQDISWGSHEASRLRTMDDLLASVTEADLDPVFSSVGVANPGEEISFIDIGAGTGVTTEELCKNRGVPYHALDVNEKLLEGRATDEGRKILGRSEDIPCPDHSFDITFSRAVTAWSEDPERAIAEQLRVTKLGGVAVFTEFDWSASGIDMSSPVAPNFMAARSIMMAAISMAGFRTEYGAELGRQIDRAAGNSGVLYERHETRHELPPGDYRDIFLGAAETLLDQLSRQETPQTVTLKQMLEGHVKVIREAESLAFRLPALVTQTVQVIDPDKLATGPVQPWIAELESKF